MSKSKGYYWERKFIECCDDHGLPAMRVPHSGSMAGYPDDVVVCDEFRIECKYRREGAGFKRMHDWIGTADALELPDTGMTFYTFDFWEVLIRARLMGEPDPAPPSLVVKRVSKQRGLLDWLQRPDGTYADFLALRKAHAPWLVGELL